MTYKCENIMYAGFSIVDCVRLLFLGLHEAHQDELCFGSTQDCSFSHGAFVLAKELVDDECLHANGLCS